MNPFSTEEFKKSQTEWYKKLKSSGFSDIEDSRGDIINHHVSQSTHFREGIKDIADSYWAWASDALYFGIFKTLRDKKIWELHTEGLSGSEISLEINLERTWVNRKILRITAYLKAQDYPVRSVLPYIKSK